METFTVRRNEVAIPVSVAGFGPAAVFAPGLCSTQADLGPLFERLRGFFRLATFDHRGHGFSSAVDRYGYADFAADAAAVVDSLPVAGPVLLGHSLGADLLLDHAATMPVPPRALVLIDGGTPLAASILTEAELAGLHEGLSSEEALAEQRSLAGTPRQWLLSADQILALQREIDDHRRTATDRFDRFAGPVTMIMSEFMAGTSMARSDEINATWLGAVDTLAADRPSITVHRIAAGHDLVLTHPDQVATLVREAVAGLASPGPDADRS
ncbi:alpha/beta fold hydrolase [Microlunatus speluncae]|uniref:alpha/beta fold hydrolase n=1 Tax=Microlunatus speluncae TaxID=2594267 RepID=UPI00137558B4|nr:alpha/beta hydrolase [Microlunatus speluncae]